MNRRTIMTSTRRGPVAGVGPGTRGQALLRRRSYGGSGG